jgi:uncharacterized protein (DUF2062 family)
MEPILVLKMAHTAAALAAAVAVAILPMEPLEVVMVLAVQYALFGDQDVVSQVP